MQLLIFVFCGTNQQRMSDQSELHRGGSTTLKIKRQFAHFLPVFFFLHFLKIFFMHFLVFVLCGTNQQRMSDQSELHRGGSTTLKIKHWFAHFLPVFFLHFLKIFFYATFNFCVLWNQPTKNVGPIRAPPGRFNNTENQASVCTFFLPVFFPHFLKIFFMQLLFFVFCGTNQQRMSKRKNDSELGHEEQKMPLLNVRDSKVAFKSKFLA